MTMCAGGLAKLGEECGELQAVVGKKLAYYDTDDHPDGAGSLKARLEDEIADVIAAAGFVASRHGLDWRRIETRCRKKRATFECWDRDPSNNQLAIDRDRSRRP